VKSFDRGGVQLTWVDGGSGPPVVLLHGFPLDHTMWDAQVEALEGDYRVIVPDLRGFGQSGVTEGKVTMQDFADDVAALLDALGIDEPVVLVGLSMGGYVAFQFFRRHRARLRALVLCDTRAVSDTSEAAAVRRETAAKVLRDGPAPLVKTMLPKLFGPATVKDRPEVVESLQRVMAGTDPRAIAAASRGMAERPDVTAMLPEIDCPTLVIVGSDDAISPPAEMRPIAAAIPGARFVEIPDAGHMTPLEDPSAVNAALVEFLGSL
jgi:3-oxoadipate enol-lactonase